MDTYDYLEYVNDKALFLSSPKELAKKADKLIQSKKNDPKNSYIMGIWIGKTLT